MTEQEIIAVIEKATGEALNEEKIKGLIGDELKKQLEPLNKNTVGIGENPDHNKKKGLTLSQFLGDVKRKNMGKPLSFMKDEDLVEIKTPVADVAKSLYEGSSAAGGSLVPTEDSRELLNLTDTMWSVLPPLCRQVPMKARQITFPTLSGGVTAYWIPETTDDMDQVNPEDFSQENGYKPPSSPTTGQKTITAHVCAVKVIVSNQLLDDSDPAVDNILRELFAEALGEKLDIAMLQGAGTTLDPLTGLDNLIATNILAAEADFNFDDLLNLLKPVRKASKSPQPIQLIGNVDAEHSLMKVKTDDGQYVYKGPTDSLGVPTVWGQPFYANENVLSTYGVASNTTRLYAGRFGRDAMRGIRAGVVVKVNPWAEPYFGHNQTAFLAEFRQGFAVTSEARFAYMGGVPVL